MSQQNKFDELSYYTLAQARTDSSFIHQYIVDAYAAQHATKKTKNIKIAFALIGLYLCVEKDYSGKKVQLVHIQLAKQRKKWPSFRPPASTGAITVGDVLMVEPGPARNLAIKEWCVSVWRAWYDSHEEVKDLVRTELGIE